MAYAAGIRGFSILDRVYQFCRTVGRKAEVPYPPQVCRELVVTARLSVLFRVRLDALIFPGC